MRIKKCINNDWYYSNQYSDSYMGAKDFEGFLNVNLPHTNKEVPYNYFDEHLTEFISCYGKIIHVNETWMTRRIFLEFEGVMSEASIYINGHYVDGHKGGFTGFSVEITDYVTIGDNYVFVRVDSTEQKDIPPYGGVLDFITYGGIYRDVHLMVTDQTYVKDTFIHCANPLETNKTFSVEFELDSTLQAANTQVEAVIENEGRKFVSAITVHTLPGVTKHQVVIKDVDNLQLWDLDTPNLYDITLSIQGDDFYDQTKVRFGVREAKFTDKGFYLNNKRIVLKGLNRHQTYPYVGYAMPKRVQQKDADILKYDLGLNMVRTSHYPQSRHFHDRCDEIGLLVFEEIPGWQHIGGDEWKNLAMMNVREMILRDRNRPSVVIWGVRINESDDDHDLYTRTNELARELDPTRQTGGVRCVEGSELLEDVYTLNDFIYEGDNQIIRTQRQATKLEHDVPYLITEFAGHMYPTKSYDQEERSIEHIMRHMLVHNAVALQENVSGAIGWCAFDYNTHSSFGAGDNICHHGVMDMFRIPKFASMFYRSQKDPSEEIIVEAATRWGFGERNVGSIFPLMVFTNCDYIDLYLGDEHRGRYLPKWDEYKGLKYPPVVIDDIEAFWGENWSGGRIVGFIGEKKVKEQVFVQNPVPTELSVIADDDCLYSDGSDATRIVVKVLDQVGNKLHFFFEPIQIKIKGEGILIGPDVVSLQGGVYAFWVKSTQQTGEISIGVSSSRLGVAKTKIRVIDSE